MLTDPQTVTVNAVAKTMPKVSTKDTSAEYRLADLSFRLLISHLVSKGRIRTLAKIVQRAVVADPLTAVNDYEELQLHVVIDRPEVGFTSTQVQQLVTGFQTWLNSTMVDKLFGQES
jgi:hypothetical protein